ncbi:cellulose synthase complex periplasmic endoglucanase BcsZ [Undibacterium sp. SXout7W]|uniref:cellulose synthase complex periplasmic endoglucanase BcsZ n=1 Tax=Undibacterium sp. SXout7W TaxID=3413049 RepID=UPI003BF0A196
MPFVSIRFSRSILSQIAALGFVCVSGMASAQNNFCEQNWPEWTQFKKTFITEDGRVIDHSGTIKPTVSEGQAYALFFALIANDKAAFQRILTWTENNLAGGDLTTRLPAWQWGQKTDGSWGIIDPNPASDADLWIAYTLNAAGELWKDKRYNALASLLAQRILNEETADIPGLGLTLLPAPKGFALPDNQWKLNPSYTPLQLLRWFHYSEKDERWKRLLSSSVSIMTKASPKGYAPDWTIYHPERGFQIDTQGSEKGNGGYNAIRVYLWAGMLADKDPDKSLLLKTWQPMATLTESKAYPPEFVDIQSGEVKSPGSTGFSAALLPFLQASKAQKALQQQILRIQAQPVKTDQYYDQVLTLFATGWMDKRYRFGTNGKIEMHWMQNCGKPF